MLLCFGMRCWKEFKWIVDSIFFRDTFFFNVLFITTSMLSYSLCCTYITSDFNTRSVCSLVSMFYIYSNVEFECFKAYTIYIQNILSLHSKHTQFTFKTYTVYIQNIHSLHSKHTLSLHSIILLSLNAITIINLCFFFTIHI